MLSVKRVAFAVCVIVTVSVAGAFYSTPPDPDSPDHRLKAAAQPGADVITVEVVPIPPGMNARGTSFPLSHGLWLTARHVANADCQEILLVLDGFSVPAQIKYLDPNADLAVLQTPGQSTPSLPIDSRPITGDKEAYAFGFPAGSLGAAEGLFEGRTHMKLGGRLNGSAPVLAWTERRRFPDSLERLTGISGGPMIDENGNVVGIIVAASAMRGRVYTVAPEILREVQYDLGMLGPQADQQPAQDAVAYPVALDSSALAMSKNSRIAKTYCIPKA